MFARKGELSCEPCELSCKERSNAQKKLLLPAGECPPKSQARAAGGILFSEW